MGRVLGFNDEEQKLVFFGINYNDMFLSFHVYVNDFMRHYHISEHALIFWCDVNGMVATCWMWFMWCASIVH